MENKFVGGKVMANSIRKELENLYVENNILQQINCSKEENGKYNQMLKEGGELPEGVFEYNESAQTGIFYTVADQGLTHEERLEYIALKQLQVNKTIKNCVLFFTVLTIISIIVAFIGLRNI